MQNFLHTSVVKSLLRPFLFVGLAAATCGMAMADLGPGSPAPKLEIKAWYKGSPIDKLDPKKTYVVEFWATWCGPCKESIPHLTELAKKNPDVTFIGVSAFEEDKDDNIKKFVADMGGKMDYTVGYTGNQDGMAKSWMMAANQGGIPTAFVVKDSKIQWIGHPMEMEKPLSEIKAGTFDSKAFKAQFDKQMVAAKEATAARKAMQECADLFKTGKHDEAKAKLDTAVKKYPDLSAAAEFQRFQWLAVEDPAGWQKQAQECADSKKPELINKLLSFALRQAAEKGEAFDRGEFALNLALKANDPPDFRALQYAASFYSTAKKPESELVYVKKIIEIFPTTPYKDDKDALKYWEDRAKQLSGN